MQVMEDEGCVRAQDGRPLEAVITEKLRHPALVAALGHATAPGPDAHDRGEKTWLLLEFCDCGSLIVRPAQHESCSQEQSGSRRLCWASQASTYS